MDDLEIIRKKLLSRKEEIEKSTPINSFPSEANRITIRQKGRHNIKNEETDKRGEFMKANKDELRKARLLHQQEQNENKKILIEKKSKEVEGKLEQEILKTRSKDKLKELTATMEGLKNKLDLLPEGSKLPPTFDMSEIKNEIKQLREEVSKRNPETESFSSTKVETKAEPKSSPQPEASKPESVSAPAPAPASAPVYYYGGLGKKKKTPYDPFGLNL